MKVDLRELKEITDRLFDHMINDLRIDTVELKQDYYWSIPVAQRYDMSKDPATNELGVGQLTEDWEFLRSIAQDRDQAVFPMFDHLAPLLLYLAEQRQVDDV